VSVALLVPVSHLPYLFGLRGERRGEQVWMKVTDSPLQPDVEKVGDVVVVGRVGDDGVEGGVGPRQRGRRPAGDGGGETSVRLGFSHADNPV